MSQDGEKQYIDIDASLEDEDNDTLEAYVNTTIATFPKPRLKTPPPEIKDDPEIVGIRKGKDETKPDANVVAVTRESQLSIASNEPRLASFHEYMRLDDITRAKDRVKRNKKDKKENGDKKDDSRCIQNWNEYIYKKPAVCISLMAIVVSLIISVISVVIVGIIMQEEMTQERQSEIRRRQKIIDATDWGEWSAWSDCSVTCDVGLQSRDRKCSPYTEGYKFHCDGAPRDYRVCFDSACEDSDWTDWTSWSSCSAICDVGTKTRFRRCNNTNPSVIVRECEGNAIDTIPCFLQACSDSKWGTWSGWSGCSPSCGVGAQTRYRRCENPSPSAMVVVCPTGAPVETRNCFNGYCSGGLWSSWSQSCGTGCISGLTYRQCSDQYACSGSPVSVSCSSCSP